jgi:hypothetical protein
MSYTTKMHATQDITISFGLSEGKTLTLTASQAKMLNKKILDLVQQNLKGAYELDGDLELYDLGFDEDAGSHFDHTHDIEFHIRTCIDVYGVYTYYPGCMYRPNGDPGDPPESDFDPNYGWIEDLDKAAILQGLKAMPVLSEVFDEDTFIATLHEYEDGEIEEEDVW